MKMRLCLFVFCCLGMYGSGMASANFSFPDQKEAASEHMRLKVVDGEYPSYAAQFQFSNVENDSVYTKTLSNCRLPRAVWDKFDHIFVVFCYTADLDARLIRFSFQSASSLLAKIEFVDIRDEHTKPCAIESSRIWAQRDKWVNICDANIGMSTVINYFHKRNNTKIDGTMEENYKNGTLQKMGIFAEEPHSN